LVLNGVDRDGLKAFLEVEGIPSMIYYPIPLHKQKAFASSDSDRSFKVTETLCDNVISLPIHTEMEDEQQEHIIDTVIQFLTRSK
jgi:dTDP-4-amino-4,6-dideoxygalactose transaminase